MRSRAVARLALILAVLSLGFGIVAGAAAANVTGTLKLDPSTTQVDNGATFSIKVISNTSVPISGVSASVTFNKAVVQVTTITRGAAWANAPLFLAADAKAITMANSKGNLQNVAAAFFPPTSVPAGDQEFITVGFKAVGCGSSDLGVPTGRVDSTLLDGRAATYGAVIKLTTAGGAVTVCQGAGSLAPGASASEQVEAASFEPGASDSFDANASPAASDSGAGAVVPPPSGGPSATQTPGDAVAGGSSSEQSGWLTFALAALAIAAAGMAALIIVLTIAAIAAVVIGSIVLYRVWRRDSERNKAPAAAAATEAEHITPNDVPAKPDAPTETGVPVLSPSPADRPLPAPSQ
jgi:hypothetical protein